MVTDWKRGSPHSVLSRIEQYANKRSFLFLLERDMRVLSCHFAAYLVATRPQYWICFEYAELSANMIDGCMHEWQMWCKFSWSLVCSYVWVWNDLDCCLMHTIVKAESTQHSTTYDFKTREKNGALRHIRWQTADRLWLLSRLSECVALFRWDSRRNTHIRFVNWLAS